MVDESNATNDAVHHDEIGFRHHYLLALGTNRQADHFTLIECRIVK